MAAAEKARDQLASPLLLNPNVSLIDIGSDQGNLIVRVHLKTEAARQIVPVPAEVNGIPVRIIIADYRIDSA